MQKEILGVMLLTEHNLTFLGRLVEAAREAIVQGSFAAFRRAAGGA
jgi:tRNA-guanine family transglycosylase